MLKGGLRMFGDLGAIKTSLEDVAKQLKQLVEKLTPTNKLVSELIEENAALRKEMAQLRTELSKRKRASSGKNPSRSDSI
jgi:regulator of replication initiation timing